MEEKLNELKRRIQSNADATEEARSAMYGERDEDLQKIFDAQT